jgi:multimeric flavodoxin WrbA
MAERKPAKKNDKPDILVISGSPRSRTCVALIDLIEQGARNAGAKTQRFLLSAKHIDPCVGCGNCGKTGNCALATRTRGGAFTDDYLELKAVLERVDALAIVAPLYFAGPPAQLKALYDRMQPYWAQRYLLGRSAPEKRPAQLFVVGGGGDAHGYAPLVGSTKSSMAVAGFNLEKVNNFIGFAAPGDVPAFPHEDEAAAYSHVQLAQLRRIIAQQEAFRQRALDSGGAFARFIVKKKQATDLAEQLARVEAELEDLRKIGDMEKPESPQMIKTSDARSSVARDHKGDLQAEIELEYSNLISRTPRDDAATLAVALDEAPGEGAVTGQAEQADQAEQNAEDALEAPVGQGAAANRAVQEAVAGQAEQAEQNAEDALEAPVGQDAAADRAVQEAVAEQAEQKAVDAQDEQGGEA